MTTWASGRCLCEAVTYTLSHRPLIVHACHCRDCQRITGSPFVVNAWVVEADLALAGALERRSLSSGSGKGQELSTCAACGCALFTRYLLTPPGTVFLRVATLDDPALAPPDVNIYASARAPWAPLPDAARGTFDGYYDMKRVWAPDSLARMRAAALAAASA